MNDHTPSQRELKSQLRTALRVDAARARISDDAWTRVRDRTSERRGWAAAPTRRPRLVIGAATAMAAAAATVAIMVVPGVVGPSNVAGPTPEGSPTGPLSAAPAAKPPPLLAATEVGTELRLRLDLVHSRRSPDRATVRLTSYRWEDGDWVQIGSGPAVVGRVDGWTASSPPAVCELRVTRPKSKLVMVRLAAARPTTDPQQDLETGSRVRARTCSRMYAFELTGDRLVARS